MKISLKTALVASFISIIVLSVGSIITSSFYSTKSVMEDHVQSIMENISTFAVDKSKSYMTIAKDAAELTHRLEYAAVVKSENIMGMEQYFYEQLRLHRQFSAIYYGNEQGDFVMVHANEKGYFSKVIRHIGDTKEVIIKEYNKEMVLESVKETTQDSYDPRVRPWYKLALDQKELIWTNPYIFFSSQKPGITTATPLYTSKDHIKGVIGVDIQIDALSGFIENIKVSENGKVFLMDKHLNVIAFPGKKTIAVDNVKQKSIMLKLHEIDDAVAQLAHRLSEKNTQHFLRFQADDDRTYYSLFLPFKINNLSWIIGIYAPEDDYLGIIKKNQIDNIKISALIGVLAIILGIVIANKIAKPIKNMREMAQELKKLNLNTPSAKPSVFHEIDEAVDSFNTMKESLKTSYNDTLFRLALSSEYKDLETAKHINRIGLYADAIGRKLGLDDNALYLLKNASSMHDIGKLGIPDTILLKPAHLTQEEREAMKKHTLLGAKILHNPTSKLMEHAREIAIYHHERYDGKGYPYGLEGDEIPIFARIVAITDVFDALVSKRCYKEPYPLEESKEIILQGKGTHFDPACVEAFEHAFDEITAIYYQYIEDC
jgi:putative two-component system response regulator